MSHSHQSPLVPRAAGTLIARRWCWLGLLLASCGFGWWASRYSAFEASVSIPTIDLSQASRELTAAVSAARAKVEQKPRSAAAWGELGMWLMAHQFEHEANVCLEQAERWDSQDSRWPYLLGLNLSVSQRDRAIVEFRRALSLRDRWAVAHSRLAELLLAKEEVDAAERELQTAREQDASDPRVCFNLSRLFLMRGDATAALVWARHAARLAPDVQAVHELLAVIHQQLGNREAAALELRISEQASISELGWQDEIAAKVLALRKDTEKQLVLAETLLQAQKPDEAIRVLRSALKQDERDLRLVVLLAKTLNQRQHRADLETFLNAAEQTHPNSAELRFQRGVSQFQSEEFAAAERSFREALQLKPDHALAHYNLGHTLLRLNRPTEAEAAFEASADFRPQFVHAHVNAARLKLKRGAVDDARKHLQWASQLSPDDPEALQLSRELSER